MAKYDKPFFFFFFFCFASVDPKTCALTATALLLLSL